MAQRVTKFFGTTTDATPLTLTSFELPPDSVGVLQVTVKGLDGSNEAFSVRVESTFKRIGSGDVAEVGTTFYSIHKETSNWDISVVGSGSSILVIATGEAGKTIQWNVHDDIFISTKL
jgi:hypothetical protein